METLGARHDLEIDGGGLTDAERRGRSERIGGPPPRGCVLPARNIVNSLVNESFTRIGNKTLSRPRELRKVV
jgi:hypothetical protein